MQCFCCRSEIALARKVRIRILLDWEPTSTDLAFWGPADWAAFSLYKRLATYHWGVVCLVCYRLLDNEGGAADIGNRHFNIAGVSRRDKAAVINEAKYRAWQQRETQKRSVKTD